MILGQGLLVLGDVRLLEHLFLRLASPGGSGPGHLDPYRVPKLFNQSGLVIIAQEVGVDQTTQYLGSSCSNLEEIVKVFSFLISKIFFPRQMSTFKMHSFIAKPNQHAKSPNE